MEKIEDFLNVLRQSSGTSWMAEEIEDTFSQGISMKAQEADTDSSFFKLVPPDQLPAPEKKKRQKYETSRPFTPDEKVGVILKSIEVAFLDVPKIRHSALENLLKFDATIESIKFVPSDNDEIYQEVLHEIKATSINGDLTESQFAYDGFKRMLENGDDDTERS
ncbi:hypothetical protein [Celerinatantimonas diazotrophica]|uniref:Uncharacterized protein n=1 Tax=Celerinatantimonas diazotrophica TaxID=412034 RepID=A0A4R1K459_9GAMM|nr:hypothetical protein [Celerinatantimonas diazotrophica]TCK58906.1 hypothetical protein EV690_1063 [Celerinatantimonas diazotrophica]CAG9297538.1 hypothetical protein CEDIAZO_02726 [Celerinatantimonas diazotrophica]